MFNNYFASHCTPIKNGSKLPNFSYKTEKILTSFDVKDDDIFPIINNINADKGHGWALSITFPLKLIFKSMTNEDVFLDD